MNKPSKLNERLTLIANIAVVAGIVFLAIEVRQNTTAIEGQTRDSLSEKQMKFTDWIGVSRDVADVFERGNNIGIATLDSAERTMYNLLVNGFLREWENSHSQYERGLFSADEYAPRVARWRLSMAQPGFREYWGLSRDFFAPDFRAEIDAIVAEIEGQ